MCIRAAGNNPAQELSPAKKVVFSMEAYEQASTVHVHAHVCNTVYIAFNVLYCDVISYFSDLSNDILQFYYGNRVITVRVCSAVNAAFNVLC